MSRVLLLCFIHGFKGTDDTFKEFPADLRRLVARQLPEHQVESVVYPKYETKGELDQATEAFVEWLKERVIDCRKRHFEKAWPPRDRNVGVVLVAHSMGGFVAADALFATLNERAANCSESDPIFPLIQGILTFDTPYNGLARSMFVYGAFSNYQKVNGVFNAMTALSAAAPATLSRLGARNAASSVSLSPSSGSRNPAWGAWQLAAVRTGTVGAIAAGGVAAYMHREAIMNGVRSIRNLNRDSLTQGYNQSVSTLGQGLAYINRGSVGQSFAWLSDHFTFVGTLMRQAELKRRLDRLAAVRGVGIHDFYCSLGENGYWSGGYFVPERTFCAVPPEEEHEAAYKLFERCVMREAEDEIKAHMTLFRPEKHKGYEVMTEKSAELVKEWFLSEDQAVDEPKLRDSGEEEKAENEAVDKVLKTAESGEAEAVEAAAVEITGEKPDDGAEGEFPDESPVDIAAAAALVPLPGSEGDLVASADPAEDTRTQGRKRTYLQYLFGIAQQTGTEAKGWWPEKVPDVSSLAKMPSSLPRVPSMPKMSSAVSSLGQVSIPSVNIFSRGGKQEMPAEPAGESSGDDEKKGEEVP